MGGKPTKTKAADLEKWRLEKKQSDKLDNQIWKDRENDSEVIKLLLLGAGESGKSTLFKQMILLYGQGFSNQELRHHVPMIHNNTIQAIKELLIQTELLAAESPDVALVDPASVAAKKFFDDVRLEDKLVPAMATHIKLLWKDPAIQAVYNLRSKFQLVDSADYFFKEVDRLASPDYLPKEMDLIRCRVRTTGIVENRFVFEKTRFLMVDVGGQRNERKKWIHCFEGVAAVIFVVAISEYDKTCYEDQKTNRMDEALKLFEETFALPYFKNTAILLFLNKRDLLEDKIKTVPITVWDPSYAGPPTDMTKVTEHIREKFIRRCKQTLYTHITCATDTNNVAAVFTAVKEIIVQRHLAESGLI